MRVYALDVKVLRNNKSTISASVGGSVGLLVAHFAPD